MSLTSEPGRKNVMLDLIRAGSSVSEMSRFGRRGDWSGNGRIGRAAARFLYPYSEDYFSCLKPVFFHELKSVDVLSAYHPLLLRDGVLALFDLFFRYPEPPMADACIFVHRDLAWTVPEAWRPVTFYYRVLPSEQSKEQAKDLYLVASIIDERHCSFAYFEEKLRECGIWARENGARINLTLTLAHVLGKNPGERDRRARISFEVSRAALRQFGDSLEYVSWEDVQRRNVQKSVFVELNPRRFYFADSFVTHHFLSKGAAPLFGEAGLREGETPLALSFFHQYALSESITGEEQRRFSEIRERWESAVKDPFFLREVKAFKKKKAFFGSTKFCSPALEDLADQLANEVETGG